MDRETVDLSDDPNDFCNRCHQPFSGASVAPWTVEQDDDAPSLCTSCARAHRASLQTED